MRSHRSGSLVMTALLAVAALAAPTAGPTTPNIIGDGRSSDSSSREYFQRMDHDRSGKISRDEFSDHITGFGGKALDEPDEIRRSMQHAFEQVDVDRDGWLSAAEANRFQRSVGISFNVDEVSEWVVHGVQLPEGIGEVFRANAVTGYDFAELIENDGAAIEEQLGIDRLAYRKKLLRVFGMVLSGAGSAPDAPQLFSAEGHGCGSVKLRWGRPDGHGFPVHKYRLFRRFYAPTAVLPSPTPQASASAPSSGWAPSPNSKAGGAAWPGGSSGSSGALAAAPTSTLYNNWELVYDGAATEVVDYGCIHHHHQVTAATAAGLQYEYQVEAWNLFGRSPLSTTLGGPSATSLNGEACAGFASNSWVAWAKRRLRVFAGLYWLLGLVVKGLGHLVLFASPVFGVTTALMRIRRSSLNHKRDAADQIHEGQVMWRVLALLSRVLPFGSYLIPPVLRTDPAMRDPSEHVVKRDGSASPAAVGTAGVTNAKPPEVLRRNSSSDQLSGGNRRSCYLCGKEFNKRSLFGRGVSHTCNGCFKHFCSSCGHTTHKYTTCPLGGDCYCRSCNEEPSGGGRSVQQAVTGGTTTATTTRRRFRRAATSVGAGEARAGSALTFSTPTRGGVSEKFEAPPVPKLQLPPRPSRSSLAPPSGRFSLRSSSSPAEQQQQQQQQQQQLGVQRGNAANGDGGGSSLARIVSGEASTEHAATQPRLPSTDVKATTRKRPSLFRSLSWNSSNPKQSAAVLTTAAAVAQAAGAAATTAAANGGSCGSVSAD
jgi:hypothetical protein